MLTPQQIRWAASHDWFVKDNGDGTIDVEDVVTIAGYTARTLIRWEFGFRALREWAGY